MITIDTDLFMTLISHSHSIFNYDFFTKNLLIMIRLIDHVFELKFSIVTFSHYF